MHYFFPHSHSLCYYPQDLMQTTNKIFRMLSRVILPPLFWYHISNSLSVYFISAKNTVEHGLKNFPHIYQPIYIHNSIGRENIVLSKYKLFLFRA